MKKSYEKDTSSYGTHPEKKYLPILSDIVEMDNEMLFIEISSNGEGYRLKLQKAGKINCPLKISLYINERIMKTFILHEDHSLDLTPLPPGSYRLAPGKYRSFCFALLK